jgi:hypothetical protein
MPGELAGPEFVDFLDDLPGGNQLSHQHGSGANHRQLQDLAPGPGFRNVNLHFSCFLRH